MKRWLMLAAALVLAAAGALAMRLPSLVTRPGDWQAMRDDLSRRPMHGDEAIHTQKFETLWKSGDFVYDPHDYHGPTLHYSTLPVVWLSGTREYKDTDEFTYRIVPLVFGVALVLMLALVADGVGRWGAIVAGVLTAISPAMVFFSRYYIQEMLLVFFTFGAMAAGWRFVRSRSPAGKVMWAIVGGLFVGLMYATKETWVIAVGCAAVATGLAWAWGRAVDAEATERRSDEATEAAKPMGWLEDGGMGGAGQPSAAATPGWRFHAVVAAVALVLAVGVGATILTAGFRHPHAVWDSVLTYKGNFARGTVENPHANPWDFYLRILVLWTGRDATHSRGAAWSEGLILALAAVGMGAALRRRTTDDGANTDTQPGFHPAFARFLTFYTLAMIAAYSAIKYKTPWCLLGFHHGLILLAGVGAVYLVRRAPHLAIGSSLAVGLLYFSASMQRVPTGSFTMIFALPKLWVILAMLGGLAVAIAVPRVLASALAAAVLMAWGAQLGNQAFRMTHLPDRTESEASRVRFNQRLDPDYNPYLYGHPGGQVMDVADRVRELAAVSPNGPAMTVTVLGRDCWPIPWYLRPLSKVACWADPEQMTTPAEKSWLNAEVVIVASASLDDELTEKLNTARRVTNYGLRKDGVLIGLYVQEGLWRKMIDARNAKKAAAH